LFYCIAELPHRGDCEERLLDPGRIPAPRFPDVRLRTPINWTAVAFLAALGSLHLAIAIPAAMHGRWEGSLSFGFAAAFLFCAWIARGWAVETALLASCRHIRVRTGTRRWYMEQQIDFESVSAVRLTLSGTCDRDARIEILTQTATLEFPPTPIPCQQALFLAMMLDVPLVKVSHGEARPTRDAAANVPLQNQSE
jgi:hypothetical protein